MPRKKVSVKKLKSSKKKSVGMTDIDSDNIELLKILLENEILDEELARLNKQRDSLQKIESKRVQEYHDLGYGHIVSPDKGIPMNMSTRNACKVILKMPTYQEIQLQNEMKRIDLLSGAFRQIGVFVLALGLLVMFV